MEDQILAMIKDAKLDDYNRVLAYFLYLNYNYNIESKKEQNQNKMRLQHAISYLPSYLKDQID